MESTTIKNGVLWILTKYWTKRSVIPIGSQRHYIISKKGDTIISYAIAASAIFTLSVITLALVESQTAAAATTTASQPSSIVTGKITFLPWDGSTGVITFLPYYANSHGGSGITLIPVTQPMSALSGV
jgi:hypothetical protein